LTDSAPEARTSLRTVAATGLVLAMAGVQFSIAVAQTLLGVAIAVWVTALALERRRPALPRYSILLAVYAAISIVSSLLSSDPAASLADCKQLVLLLIVPMTYDLIGAQAAAVAATAVVSAGAVSSVVGIGQYALLNYDNLGLRARGTLGMYMTYSGLTMLVVALAMAQVLFARKGRTWPALVVPALAVALAVTFTRNTWMGAFAALSLLLLLKDFRLLALLPVVAAVFLTLAPGDIVQRFYSIFDLQDLSNRDRLAMMSAGRQIVRDHPLVGVGPNMVIRVYPEYRAENAVVERAPHLHNVPMQIAAERGLPALGVWLWFVGVLVVDLWRLFRSGPERWLPAAGLASVVAMLTAGLFEYNFGDSEFLMLFLFLITLPFGARRSATADATAQFTSDNLQFTKRTDLRFGHL
jgi:O-antigen ligase